MALRVRVPLAGQLGTSTVERVLREVIDALRGIVGDVRRDIVIRGVELPNALDVPVLHGLGYGYEHVSVSPPRGSISTSGRIEIRAPTDASKSVILRATGFGATVTVDIRVT